MPDLAYVDGCFVPLEKARVPLSDRAYYFADAVYEVFTTFGGDIFMFDAHMDRLEQSLQGVKIDYEVNRETLAGIFGEGIAEAGYAESLIYLQISRGCAIRDKHFPISDERNLIVTFRQKPSLPPERFSRGIKIILTPDDRWGHCNFKTIMLLPNVLALQAATERKKDDAVFFDPASETVYEATSANVFMVKNGGLFTPKECDKILSGTVRRHVIDLARRNNIQVDERPASVEEFRQCDEAFLTGTTTEVLGIVEMDDAPVGDGMPGPLTRRLHDLFRESVGLQPNGD